MAPEITPEIKRITELLADAHLIARRHTATTVRDLWFQRELAYATALVVLTAQPEDRRTEDEQAKDLTHALDESYGSMSTVEGLAQVAQEFLVEVHQSGV